MARASDDRLYEDRLRALSVEVDFPDTPDLAPRVRQHLELAPSRASRPGFLGWRPAAFAAAAVFAALAFLLTFSPATREAVADFLGIGGVRIEYGGGESTRPPIARELDLGESATLDEARGLVDFDIRIPTELGEPDEVYTLDFPPGGAVSLVYAPRAGLPEAAETRVGAVLTEFRAELQSEVILKKLAGSGVEIDIVSIDGSEGYWIEGQHSVGYVDAEGQFREDTARLAGNTLIWVEDDVTYRLESALDKEAALSIARSVP